MIAAATIPPTTISDNTPVASTPRESCAMREPIEVDRGHLITPVIDRMARV
jgi:hypothetical protein